MVGLLGCMRYHQAYVNVAFVSGRDLIRDFDVNFAILK